MHLYKQGQQQENVSDYQYNNVRFKEPTGVLQTVCGEKDP